MKVQKYFMRTRMHGTPTGRPDYVPAAVSVDTALQLGAHSRAILF